MAWALLWLLKGLRKFPVSIIMTISVRKVTKVTADNILKKYQKD